MRSAKILFPLLMAVSLLFSSCQHDDLILVPAHRLQWWLSAIEWDEKRLPYAGKGIRIAILDSGVDVLHPDLEGKIEKSLSVLGGNDNIGNNDHGTAVAGVIAASPHNTKGVLGIAPEAKILSIDVTDDINGVVEVKNLVAGIQLAVQQKVQIINISVGVKETSVELEEAIAIAHNAGILMISSAGNYMESDVLYPAKYATVICVGAKKKNGEIISPKNFDEKAVIFLPGENIVTTLSGGSYSGAFGTSVSAPILTGIVAVIMEANPKLSTEQLIDFIVGIANQQKISVPNLLEKVKLL